MLRYSFLCCCLLQITFAFGLNSDSDNGGYGGANTAQAAPSWQTAYLQDVQRRVKRYWFPPKGNETKRVVVQFTIHKAGEVSNLKLELSSGVSAADQAALKAVENGAPMRPVPADKDLSIKFTFDYNQFQGGGEAVIVKESEPVAIPVRPSN